VPGSMDVWRRDVCLGGSTNRGPVFKVVMLPNLRLSRE
jgi:hypothetical protein